MHPSFSLDNFTQLVSQGQGATKNMTIIAAKQNQFSSIASLEPVDIVNGTGAGIVVSTRVPTNIFDFESSLILEITGEVVIKLTGDSNHHTLRADVGASLDTNKKTAFSLQVVLMQGFVSEEGPMSSDASVSVASKGFVAALGMIFSLAYAMW